LELDEVILRKSVSGSGSHAVRRTIRDHRARVDVLEILHASHIAFRTAEGQPHVLLATVSPAELKVAKRKPKAKRKRG
jgi:hypothetical protein